MQRRQDITLAMFRRHWLDVHGPLACGFPELRNYLQHHVIASPAMTAPAHDMLIDGFPSTARLAEQAFTTLVDLECAVAGDDTGAAHFVVEEHRLV
jgi:EthD domain